VCEGGGEGGGGVEEEFGWEGCSGLMVSWSSLLEGVLGITVGFEGRRSCMN